jgi:uncharacterized protein (TIGR03083 family)
VSVAESQLRSLLAESCAALADALAAIPAARWGEASMCEGWSVAHVIAHLTMAARYDEASFGAELAADGFDFQAMSDRVALRDAELPVEIMLANLRSDVMANFAMPGGGLAGSLSHVVIHGLDATWPLGLGRSCPDDAVGTVLTDLVSSSPNVFGVDVDGLVLRATDAEWSHGRGPAVERTAGELLLALSGRRMSL